MNSRKNVILKVIPRTLFIFLIVLIFFLPQAQAASVFVSPANKTVEQGQSFYLDISIDPLGTAISGAQLDILFNKSLLTLNNIIEGNLFKQDGASTYFYNGTINNSEGIAKNMFIVILGQYKISRSGTFLRFNFTPIGQSGVGDIKLSNVLISDLDGMAVPFIVTDGSININSAPVMYNIGNKNIFEGQNLTFTLSSTDLNGDPLAYSASNLPPGAMFNPATATFMWTPNQSGIFQNLHFEVSDGMAVDSNDITIIVYKIKENNITEIVVTPSSKNVTFGQDFFLNVSIDPKGTGIAGAQLNIAVNRSTLRVNNIREGNLFKQSGQSTIFDSGVIDNTQGTAANIYAALIGSSNVTTQGTFIIINATAIGSGTSGFDLSNIMITDQLGASVAYNLTNGTININSPPVLTLIDNRIVNEGQLLSFNLTASGNGNTLSYSASNMPSGATFDQTTKTFMWTPTFFQSGIYPDVRFEVTDGILMGSENITITVNNINQPPTLTAIPSNGSIFKETDIIYISAIAFDADNDTIYYSIKIDGIQVSTSPVYDWLTSYSSSGNHEINISVSDGTEVVSKTIQVYINNAYPRYDINENGRVEIGDIAVIGQHFNEIVTPPYPRYDINMDGMVNIADLVIAGQHFDEAT